MAETMRLTEGGNTVDLSPLPGYQRPEYRNRAMNTAIDGSMYIYEWGNKDRFHVSVNNIDSTDFGYILAWWQNGTTITFYPDMINDSGTSVSVKIINDERPLNMMFSSGWATNYEGQLIMQVV
jgi:hypothetical protein